MSGGQRLLLLQTIHGAVAAAHLGHDEALVPETVKTDWEDAKIEPKLKRC